MNYRLFLYKFLLFLFIFESINTTTFSINADSLKVIKKEHYKNIKTTNNDSVRIINSIRLGLALHASDVEMYKNKSGKDYIMQAIDLASKKHIFGNIGYYIDSIGVKQRDAGKYTMALRLHNISLNYATKKHDNKLMSIAYNNIGVAYRRIDDYKKSLNNHFKALEIAEKMDDTVSMAIAINSIGNVELMLGDYEEGLKYFKNSLKLEQNRNNLTGIAINLENIGTVFFYKKKYEKAIEYFKLSLEINKKIKSNKGIAICYSDLAEVYKSRKKYKAGELYLKHSMILNKNIGDKLYLSDNYLSLGEIYAETGKYEKAKKMLLYGLKLSKALGVKSNVEKGYHTLYFIYKKQYKYKNALRYLEMANIYHDSVMNITLQKEIARLQMQFETERKENQIILLKQQAKIRELNLKKQKFLNYFLLTAFVTALIIVFFLSVYLHNKNRLNKILLEKNHEIEIAKKKLEMSGIELIKAKQKAEESDKSKSEFLANMSHEIRTPLNSVIGFSDLLATIITDPKKTQYVNSIKSSGENLLILINDILDLSKIEAGKFEVEFVPINIYDVFEEVQKMFLLQANKKNLEFILLIDKQLPDKIMFSAIRLRQILFNLIGNAIKFTKEGSINILVNYEYGENNNLINLRIVVKDTGKGIAKKDQELIFKPFYQSVNENNEIGTGLGLAITKRLVDVLGGKIFLKSELGSGSEFTLLFENVKIAQDFPGIKAKIDNIGTFPYSVLFLANNDKNFIPIKDFIGLKMNKVIDVGTNLQVAKQNILKCNLVIINGFKHEMLINTMQIIKKENPEMFCIIIGSKLKQSFKNTSIIDDKLPVKEIIDKLINRINKFDYLTTTACMFLDNNNSVPEGNFTVKLESIVNNEFKKSMDTKMLHHISIFSKKLAIIATEAHLPALLRYSEELKTLVEEFDITGIEEKLSMFKQAYNMKFANR